MGRVAAPDDLPGVGSTALLSAEPGFKGLWIIRGQFQEPAVSAVGIATVQLFVMSEKIVPFTVEASPAARGPCPGRSFGDFWRKSQGLSLPFCWNNLTFGGQNPNLQ